MSTSSCVLFCNPLDRGSFPYIAHFFQSVFSSVIFFFSSWSSDLHFLIYFQYTGNIEPDAVLMHWLVLMHETRLCLYCEGYVYIVLGHSVSLQAPVMSWEHLLMSFSLVCSWRNPEHILGAAPPWTSLLEGCQGPPLTHSVTSVSLNIHCLC